MGLRWLSRLSDGLPAQLHEVVGWSPRIAEHLISRWNRSSTPKQPKVVGFLQVLQFPPTGKVDRRSN